MQFSPSLTKFYFSIHNRLCFQATFRYIEIYISNPVARQGILVMRKFGALLSVAMIGLVSTPAYSFDWSLAGAKVMAIEATYMPNSVDFEIDEAAGSCAAGSILTWTAQGADATSKAQNVEAVFSLLMTAKSSGQTVTVYGSNSGCQVNFIYLQ